MTIAPVRLAVTFSIGFMRLESDKACDHRAAGAIVPFENVRSATSRASRC
jgi:hypothetical protein